MQRYLVLLYFLFFFFNDTATTEIYTLSLHDALPIRANASGARGHSSAWAAWRRGLTSCPGTPDMVGKNLSPRGRTRCELSACWMESARESSPGGADLALAARQTQTMRATLAAAWLPYWRIRHPLQCLKRC